MKLLLSLPFLLSINLLMAQTFTEVTQSPPLTGVSSSMVAFADVDGDDDQDVIIAGFTNVIGANTKLYINDGTGSFTEMEGTPFEAISRGAIAFADIDGDNDQDLLLTGQNRFEDRIAIMYTNDGTGNFTEVPNTPFEGVYFSSIAFADIDGDNDQDVFITGTRIASLGLMSKLYTNDGMGNFTEVSGTPFDPLRTGATAFADLDGDNDLDLLMTGENDSFDDVAKLYANDGMGNFTEVSGTPFIGVGWGSLAVADVDGDDDQDVLITGKNNEGEGLIAKLYTNDGLSSFTEVTNTPFEGVQFTAIAFADVDNDNDQDVLITGRRITGLPSMSKLYTNDGAGIFSELANTPFDSISSGAVAFADVDNDDDQDVLLVGSNWFGEQTAKLYINDGVTSTRRIQPLNLELDVKLFPNPTKANSLNINFDAEENGLVQIEVYGMEGQRLHRQQSLVVIGQQTLRIDITSLAAGHYLLQLDDGKRKGVAKFVVE